MATNAKLVKNSVRTRQAAKKAGLKIVEQNETKHKMPAIEQEQPDIM